MRPVQLDFDLRIVLALPAQLGPHCVNQLGPGILFRVHELRVLLLPGIVRRPGAQIVFQGSEVHVEFDERLWVGPKGTGRFRALDGLSQEFNLGKVLDPALLQRFEDIWVPVLQFMSSGFPKRSETVVAVSGVVQESRDFRVGPGMDQRVPNQGDRRFGRAIRFCGSQKGRDVPPVSGLSAHDKVDFGRRVFGAQFGQLGANLRPIRVGAGDIDQTSRSVARRGDPGVGCRDHVGTGVSTDNMGELFGQWDRCLWRQQTRIA